MSDGYFLKPPLSFSAQAEKLISEGLLADKDNLVSKLKVVNYDRLAWYWYGFKETDDNLRFEPNTTFEMVWQSYRFDRRLRLLVMDAIERVEIAIRTQVVNFHVLRYGAFGYLKKSNFKYPNRVFDTGKALNRFSVEYCQKSMNDPLIEKYKENYSEEKYFPFWKLVELLNFGWMKNIFLAVDNDISAEIIKPFDIRKDIMKSWLESLRIVRNICAHHSRLFNRRKLYDVKMPPRKHSPDWYEPVKIATSVNKGKLFPILTILGYMLKVIIPESGWMSRLTELLENKNFEIVPKNIMGFPENWESSPLWNFDKKTDQGVKNGNP